MRKPDTMVLHSPDPVCLDRLPLFDALSAPTRQRLLALSTERAYTEGQELFHAGDTPRGIYIVISGRVRVVRAHDGRRQVVHTEGPGGTLAEVPVFEGGTLPATAVAIEPTHCLLIPSQGLHELMREDPAIALLFLKRLSSRVRELVDRLDRSMHHSVLSRLAQYLHERASASRAPTFTLGMTQSALAEELGTVREVIVRSLSQLRDQGAIDSAGRGRYRVVSVARLREIAVR